MIGDRPSEQAAGTGGGRADPLDEAEDRPATILVVDDEPYARQLLTDLLVAQGFQVVSVAAGEEAFGRLGGIDLVLLDAMLPGRDGWSICREIKERIDPLLPVIMVTARTAPDDVVRTFDAGADDYVAKPFHAAELMARIESRLRVHRAERALQRMNRRLAELADQNYRLYQKACADAEERALLLREIDHRVRNNLSVIMGLVSMERSRRPPRPAEEALASLENRFRSFLVVYDSLRRRQYRTIPVREIVERLAQRLRNTLAPDTPIELRISGEVADLGERQGFSVALAINELITNAIRHAFPDGRAGTVSIHMADVGPDVRIEVADDGIGAPPCLGQELVGSGRSIVDAVVRGDLSGRVDYLPTPRGARVVITFPRECDGAQRAEPSISPGSDRSPSRGPARCNPATLAP
jgi:DNA-binding response OmpR family regulator